MDSKSLIREELRIVNVGLENFYLSLKEQKARVAQVNVQRKRKLEKDIEDALDRLL